MYDLKLIQMYKEINLTTLLVETRQCYSCAGNHENFEKKKGIFSGDISGLSASVSPSPVFHLSPCVPVSLSSCLITSAFHSAYLSSTLLPMVALLMEKNLFTVSSGIDMV